MNVHERHALVLKPWLDKDEESRNPLDLNTWKNASLDDSFHNLDYSSGNKINGNSNNHRNRLPVVRLTLDNHNTTTSTAQRPATRKAPTRNLSGTLAAMRRREQQDKQAKLKSLEDASERWKERLKTQAMEEQRRRAEAKAARLEAKRQAKFQAKKAAMYQAKCEQRAKEREERRLKAQEQLKRAQAEAREKEAQRRANELRRLQNYFRELRWRKAEEARKAREAAERTQEKYDSSIGEHSFWEEIIDDDDDDYEEEEEILEESFVLSGDEDVIEEEEYMTDNEYFELEQSAYLFYLQDEEEKEAEEERLRMEESKLEEERDAARKARLSEAELEAERIEDAKLKAKRQAEQEEERKRAEHAEILRRKKHVRLSTLEKELGESRHRAEEESRRREKQQEDIAKREHFEDVSKHLEESLRFKPMKTLAEVEGATSLKQQQEDEEPNYLERRIGEVPPALKAMILQASLEIRPVPEEHKKSYMPITEEAASMGRLTRLNEHVLEAQGRKSLDMTKENFLRAQVLTKPKGRRRRQKLLVTKHSNSERIMYEAAAMGRIIHRKEDVLSEYGRKGPRLSVNLEETDDREVDDLRDEHGARVIRTHYLTAKHMNLRKVLARDWLDGLDEDVPDVDTVQLPSDKLPSFKKPPSIFQSPVQIKAHLPQAVAEGYWNRYSRLERPGAPLRVTEGCDCVYCARPSEAQTLAYQKKWANAKLAGICTSSRKLNPNGSNNDGDGDDHGWLTGLYLPTES